MLTPLGVSPPFIFHFTHVFYLPHEGICRKKRVAHAGTRESSTKVDALFTKKKREFFH